jgi:hypothetical protein
VVDSSKLALSNKYAFIRDKMKPGNRPAIVSLDWMLDCMEKGEILAVEDKYKVVI